MNKITYFLIGSTLLLPSIAMSQERPMCNNTELTPVANAASQSEEDYGIITEVPEGTTTQLVRSGCSYYVTNSGMNVGTYQDMMGEIVFSDNGEVYLKNPISKKPTGTYLKGYQDGNTLVFELPQTLYKDILTGEVMSVTTLQFTEVYMNYVPANTSISAEVNLPEIDNKWVININEDGTYSYDMDLRPDGYAATMIGLVYDDGITWNGFAEVYSDWAPQTEEPLSVPADLEISRVEIHSGETAYLGGISFDGDDVYLRGLFNFMPDSWIKGKLNGDKVTFLTDQYLGGAEDFNYYAYFISGKMVPVGDGKVTIEKTDQIEFTYDESAQTLTSGEDQTMVCNAGPSDIIVMTYMVEPYFIIQPKDISQTPANPYDLVFNNMWDFGLNTISFRLPDVNVDGQLLNPANLYYKVFFDGEPYTFMEDEYYFLTENMTLIPYGFIDRQDLGRGWDFGIDGNRREISLYFDGADNFGIQLYNIVDGVTLGESALVTKEILTGVKENIAPAATIVSTVYHDLSGREVSASFKGMYLKTVKYSDGTVRTFKEINR